MSYLHRWHILILLLLFPFIGWSAPADLERQILSASLDPAECYRVHEIAIHQGGASFFLTDGYLIFGKPVNGAPINAVFVTDVEGGDAEVVLIPPDRAERKTMASFTGSPNIDEHFTQAVFFFTDREARGLAETVRKSEFAERVPAYGLLMADRWSVTVTNMLSSFSTRILLDLLADGEGEAGGGGGSVAGGGPGRGGAAVAGGIEVGDGGGGAGSFFDATLRGRTLGDFDIVHDSRATEQIAAGKYTPLNGVPLWETWTRFVDDDHKGKPEPAPEENILSYKIDASLDASLVLHCTTRIHVRATADSRFVMPFELASGMRVLSAKVDGVVAEVFQRQSMRDGLVQNSGNELILIVPAAQPPGIVPATPLAAGTEHEVEIVHEGKVVQDAGNGIYAVSARGTWYPGRGAQFATYDVTWKYPENLDLVSAGAMKEDQTAGGFRTNRRTPEGKMRLLGFNVGRYTVQTAQKDGISLVVSANREFEASLRKATMRPAVVVPDALPTGRNVRVPQMVQSMELPAEPADRIQAISDEMLSAIQFFRSKFGEPPERHIEVSPVTGRFGQGFAGMIYLPTLMYINPADMPSRLNSTIDDAFMGQLLRVHETAHQWWGNIVATDSYHHEWLMESLANYSALMYLESRMGPKAIEKGLELYREELVARGPDGATAESRGPVVEGRRLESAAQPGASNAVLYGKGTWIIHMLRRRMGDAGFLKMLAELRRRYEGKTITTEEFRALCAEYAAGMGDFFDVWVYDTGMPTLKLTYTVAGGKLTGMVAQSDVPEDFNVAVPVEVRTAGGKLVVKMVRTGVKFSVEGGLRAALDPGWWVMKR